MFDVLSLLELSYGMRRELLDELALDRPGLRVPVNFTDITGDVVLAAVRQQSLEGVVAKRLVSTYQPGRRSRARIKTQIRHTAEVIVAGWSPSTGNKNVLGALLLAAHNPGRRPGTGGAGPRAADRVSGPFAGASPRPR